MHSIRTLCRKQPIFNVAIQKCFFHTSPVACGTTPAQLKEMQSAAAKKSSLIAKYTNLAYGAISSGGGSIDPVVNKKLHQVLEQCTKDGVPKSKVLAIISNKIDKPSHTFFITTPSGMGAIIECQSRSIHHARTVLTSCLKKSMFNAMLSDQKLIDDYFDKKGVVMVSEPLKDGKELNEDERTELALDIDAEDVLPDGKNLKFICSPGSLKDVVQSLEELNFDVVYSAVDFVPTAPCQPSDDDKEFYKYFIQLLQATSENPQRSCQLSVIATNFE